MKNQKKSAIFSLKETQVKETVDYTGKDEALLKEEHDGFLLEGEGGWVKVSVFSLASPSKMPLCRSVSYSHPTSFYLSRFFPYEFLAKWRRLSYTIAIQVLN